MAYGCGARPPGRVPPLAAPLPARHPRPRRHRLLPPPARYETRTDDITMIIIQFAGLDGSEAPGNAMPPPAAPHAHALSEIGVQVGVGGGGAERGVTGRPPW